MEEKKKKPLIITIIVISVVVLLACLLAAGLYYFVFVRDKGVSGYASDTSGPDVQFIAPLSGTEAEVGDTVSTHVSAADVSGVVLLELWINGKLSLSQPSPEDNGISPLTLFHGLKAYEQGTYTLVARAYNTSGAVTESPAVVVVVNPDTGADDSPIIYDVQDGEDLDGIAAKSGVSVADIKAANPGVQNVKPNQKIAIPKNNKNNPPSNPPNNKLPGLQPQALPGLLPGISVGAQGIVGHLLPEIAPDAGINIAGIASLQGIPDGLSAKVDGCKVTLSWKDNTQGETGFAIYRRRLPGQVGPTMVSVASANAVSFEDTVPYPAEYEYQIESVGGVINQAPANKANVGLKGVQQIVDPKRSQPFKVKVEPSEKCIQDPQSFKLIYLTITDLNPVNSTHNMAALWVAVDQGLTYRVPLDDYQDAVTWQQTPQFNIPVPVNTRLNPDQPFILKFWAAAYTEQAWKDKSEGPKDLGTAFVSHKINEIPQNNVTYSVNGPLFSVDYKIYADDVKWDANTKDATCLGAVVPQNLTVDSNYKDARRLQWKYEANLQPDGFLLYRSYSCPGQEAVIQAPIYIPNQPARARQYDINFHTEPGGCRYVYELASMDTCGQSRRSNAVTGDTEAGDVLQVTFKQLKILDMPTADKFPAASLTLRAGYLSRKSNIFSVNTGTNKLLAHALIAGKTLNNTFELVLGASQSPEVFFAVNGIDALGDEIFASVCVDTLTLPPIADWPDKQRTEVIQSFDGNCEMTVEFNLVKAKADKTGTTVLPEADLGITDIATIGKRYYARIVNNGPNQLTNNQIWVQPRFGARCPDGVFYTTSPHYDLDVWIANNTPLWVYLGDDYSELAGKIVDRFLSGEDLEQVSPGGERCPFALFAELREHDDLYNYSYTDNNQTNNLLFVFGKDLHPMQVNP